MSDLDRIARRVEQLEALMRHLYDDVEALRGAVGPGLGRNASSSPAPPGGAGSGSAREVADPLLADAPEGLLAGSHSLPDPAPALAPGAMPLGAPAAALEPAAAGAGQSMPRTAPHTGQLLDLESLVGRYGALALATATILLGVGAFVSWAIERRLLGPHVRVVLGLLAAAAVGGAGEWLRLRGTRRFGNVLLALALAIVHVDAWGAGPELRVVSPAVALACAALASAALGWIALREAQQTLFAVGVGGALLAPFVTSTGEAHVAALLAFGFAVVALTMLAIRDRDWDLPVLLMALGVAGYTRTAAAAASRGSLEIYAPAGFAILCAAVAIGIMPPRHRSVMAQVALASLWGALTLLTAQGAPVERVIGGAAVGTLAAYATIPGLGMAPRRTYVGALALPVAFLALALWTLPAGFTPRGASLALAWGVGAVAAAVVFTGIGRDAPGDEGWSARVGAAIAQATAGGAGAVAIVLALGAHRPAAAIIALSAYAVGLTVVAVEARWNALLAAVGVTLVVAVAWSWWLLDARPTYGYLPFLTHPSAAAAAVVVASAVAIEVLARAPDQGRVGTSLDWRRMRLVPAALLFLWGRSELAGAGSRELSTFLLITYYAVAGVGAVFVGRARGIAPLRHVGLAIAVYGALKAVAEASNLGIALRVGSYLLAGAFLLAVAYWYRASAGEQRGE